MPIGDSRSGPACGASACRRLRRQRAAGGMAINSGDRISIYYAPGRVRDANSIDSIQEAERPAALKYRQLLRDPIDRARLILNDDHVELIGAWT